MATSAMKIIMLRTRWISAATLLLAMALCSGTVVAQQKQLSIEELNDYIQEQKAALEEAIANRDETEAKAREVQEALAEQDARREQLENEVDELCLELDVAEPGSYDDCKAQYGS